MRRRRKKDACGRECRRGWSGGKLGEKDLRIWRGARRRDCCGREGFEVSAAFLFFGGFSFRFDGDDWRAL